MLNHKDLVMREFLPFLRYFKEGKKDFKVLEVGHGDSFEFKKAIEENNGEWSGADPKKPAINNASCFMEDLNLFDDESFDLVFGCHCFEHCEHPLIALGEFLRVLKPRGTLFLATPNPCYHQVLGADTDHIFCLSRDQMVRLLLYAGFRECDVYLQNRGILNEQDFNIISIARKE